MNWYKTALKVKKLTDEEVKLMPNYQEFINEIIRASRDYEMHESEFDRCDFCEPNCTCDRDFMQGLVDGVSEKFPNVSDQTIYNYIYDAKGS